MIRLEEKRAKERRDLDTLKSLYDHRIQVVRVECRASLLLYVYSKWRYEHANARINEKWNYSRVEKNCNKHCWFRLRAIRKAKEMGKRFGVDTKEFDNWLGT